jgi:hypothetical protein
VYACSFSYAEMAYNNNGRSHNMIFGLLQILFGSLSPEDKEKFYEFITSALGKIAEGAGKGIAKSAAKKK